MSVAADQRQQAQTPADAQHGSRPTPQGLDISIRTGSGTGRTLLSAFDHALHRAGVADFNLVTLSSVIPTGSRIRHVDAPLPGGHGDLLFCVRAEAFAEHPGDTAWSGLGWCTDETGGGLFVEHHGASDQVVTDLIEASLADMNASRGGGYGPVTMALTSATCVDQPVCALVLAAYRVSSWHGGEPDADPAPTQPGRRDDAEPPEVGPRTTHGHGVTAGPSSEPPLHDDEVVRVSPVAAAAVPAPHSPGPGPVARVSMEKEVDYATAKLYYQLYRASFVDLETVAVARHMLHESEFLEEMLDPRVHKYIAWDDEDRAIAMTTLTSDLATVPWITPAYFAHHYPEHVARNALYYVGFTLVHPDHQGSHVLHSILGPMGQEVISNDGMLAWDVCAANDERGFIRTYLSMFTRLGVVDIEAVDRQTYYAATYTGPPETTPFG